MNDIILQGLATAVPIIIGVIGMLINNWVSSYRDDKHFYKTRFLDRDGNPDSSDPGFIKDDSGKMIPIIVNKYSFGKRKKKRFVEFIEISGCGEYGFPRKESLKAFRSKCILRPMVQLGSNDKFMVLENKLLAHTLVTSLSDRVGRVENIQKEHGQIIIRDLSKIFGEIKDLLDLNTRIQKIEVGNSIFHSTPEIPMQLFKPDKDMARDLTHSVDGLKATIQHHRKAVVKLSSKLTAYLEKDLDLGPLFPREAKLKS